MIICGIDPGRTGGVCLLQVFPSGVVEVDARIMPPPDELADVLDKHPVTHVFIERAHSMPKQGVVSMFNYGDHYGQLQGICIALKLPFTLVHPRIWTRLMHQGCTGLGKAKSLQAARRLFPEVDFVPEGCRKPHSGVFESTLIAEYGRRSLSGVGSQKFAM